MRRVLIHVGALIVLALPFLVVGYEASRNLFLSNLHAHLIEKALLVRDRGRVELIGFVYPPLPFFLLLPWPRPLAASLLAALIGAATGWVLWQRLSGLPFPRLVQVLLLFTAMVTPSSLYLASQALGDMLALLLFLIAWVQFIAFTRAGETHAGFMAGLTLGGAFFVNHYAALYAIPYALFAPLFLKERREWAGLAAAFVLFFPTLLALGMWMYVSWVFTADPLRFLHDPTSSLFAYLRAGTEVLPIGWSLALRASAREVLATPLYVATGVVVAVRWPLRLPAYLVPLALITTVRAYGMVYPAPFALSTYTVVALAALSPRLPRHAWPLFLAAALLHLFMGSRAPMNGEMQRWIQVIRDSQPTPADLEEQRVGEYLASLPPHSVLLDDRIAYRIVARAGTARPFLLPADALYPLAVSQPAAFVQYVLVPAQPAGGIGRRAAYAATPPQGFDLQENWPHWRLYARRSLPETPAASR